MQGWMRLAGKAVLNQPTSWPRPHSGEQSVPRALVRSDRPAARRSPGPSRPSPSAPTRICAWKARGGSRWARGCSPRRLSRPVLASIDYCGISSRMRSTHLASRTSPPLILRSRAQLHAEHARQRLHHHHHLRHVPKRYQLIARGIDIQLPCRRVTRARRTSRCFANRVRDLITVDPLCVKVLAAQTGLCAGTLPGIANWTIDGTASLELAEFFQFTMYLRWIDEGLLQRSRRERCSIASSGSPSRIRCPAAPISNCWQWPRRSAR